MQNGKPKKVLIIDDDLALCESLKLILEPKDFIVASASNGTDGIRLCQEWQPDIVVLDLLMPGMDGWEVAARIRSFSDVPIIVLSAVSKPELVAKALDEGIDEYLIKPVPGSVLAAHLKRLTWRSHTPSPNP
ncbi:MAG: putative two-component response regulator [Anaerolineae bacterium]|nr:MAG: putative two-component response regulator [Anaerolineae bacterium]